MSGKTGTSSAKSKVIGKSKDTAKAWINFNGNGDVVRSSFNVSSMGFDGSGEYAINLSTTLSTNAVAVGGCDPHVGVATFGAGAMTLIMNTATQIKCITADYSVGGNYIKAVDQYDYFWVMIAVFGD